MFQNKNDPENLSNLNIVHSLFEANKNRSVSDCEYNLQIAKVDRDNEPKCVLVQGADVDAKYECGRAQPVCVSSQAGWTVILLYNQSIQYNWRRRTALPTPKPA